MLIALDLCNIAFMADENVHVWLLQEHERGLHFLKTISLCGHNLSAHLEDELPDDGLEHLVSKTIADISLAEGPRLAAMQQIIAGDWKVRKCLSCICNLLVPGICLCIGICMG